MVLDRLGSEGKQGKRRVPARLLQQDLLRVSIAKADLVVRYRQVMKTMDSRLADYVERHDEDSVHDFRTAARRAQATVRLLPKGLRRAEPTKRFLKSSKAAVKLSSRLRDLDIIKARMGTLPRSELRDALLIELGNRRLSLLKEARRTAKALSRNSLEKDLVGRVTTKRLEKRFRKVVGGLGQNINRALPVVLGDATKKRQLHLLRMDCKRLRYTLEAAREDANRDKLLKTLEGWSDTLGAVHDWDVVTAYLTERPHRNQPLMEPAAERRDSEYQKFVTLSS